MANFAVSNSTFGSAAANAQQAIGAAYKTQVAVGNSSATAATIGFGGPRRGKIYDLLMGMPSAPGDTALEVDLQRAVIGSTPSGTTSISSLSSAYMLDPADAGFQLYSAVNSSAEVGVTALAGEPWYIALNQRASYRWVANPGSEIVFPAQSSGSSHNGLVYRARSASYTGLFSGTLYCQEQ